MAGKLAKETAKAVGAPNALRSGTVTAVSSAGVSVNVSGGLLAGLAYLDSAPPKVGDTVSLFKQDQTWVALGRATTSSGQWSPVTLVNLFTNGGGAQPPMSYRVTADNNLQVYGWIVSGTNTGSGTVVGTVPVLPVNTARQPVLQVMNVSTGVSLWAALALNATTGLGELQMHGTWANTNVILFNGVYPLDL